MYCVGRGNIVQVFVFLVVVSLSSGIKLHHSKLNDIACLVVVACFLVVLRQTTVEGLTMFLLLTQHVCAGVNLEENGVLKENA